VVLLSARRRRQSGARLFCRPIGLGNSPGGLSTGCSHALRRSSESPGGDALGPVRFDTRINLVERICQRMSRRDRVKRAAAAGVSKTLHTRFIEKALAGNGDPSMMWLQRQGCGGCPVSLPTSFRPSLRTLTVLQGKILRSRPAKREARSTKLEIPNQSKAPSTNDRNLAAAPRSPFGMSSAAPATPFVMSSAAPAEPRHLAAATVCPSFSGRGLRSRRAGVSDFGFSISDFLLCPPSLMNCRDCYDGMHVITDRVPGRWG